MSKRQDAPFSLSCPAPKSTQSVITLAHGEGARLTRRLIREEIATRFPSAALQPLGDSAILRDLRGPLCFTADSSIVSPLFFPGGDIGRLAVHGAVNDLAVSGAIPKRLSLAMILEEGLELDTLRRVLDSVAKAANECGVDIVTGDTKVAPRGAVDRLFVSVAGIGELREGTDWGPHQARSGDAILVSGAVAEHGLAVLTAREGLEIEGLQSDTAPLTGLVSALVDSQTQVRMLRDATRGGVAAVLHEWIEQGPWQARLDERSLPVSEAARGACELLGLDPWHIANEGVLVALVASEDADRAVRAMRGHPLGARAAKIGELDASEPRFVTVRTLFGSERVLDEPAGAPLPRIC